MLTEVIPAMRDRGRQLELPVFELIDDAATWAAAARGDEM
jgi:hypothetical protein